MLPPTTSIGDVHLTVADVTSAADFYRNVLGFRAAGSSGARTVFLSADGRYPYHVILTGDPGARPSPHRAAGLYHFAILLPTHKDLGSTLRHLVEVGWPLQGASDHGVSEALYLADPEGNGIEIYADRARGRWPRRDRDLVMPTRPLGIDELLAESEGGWEGFPSGSRIGHVHLRVADLKRSEAFYGGMLGFDVTVRTYPGALFLAAGGYHHHIGLNTWAGTDIPPASPEARGLRTFTIRLSDRAELGRLIRRVREAGVIVESAVDHGVRIAVTVRDPDGIGVMLAADVPGQNSWEDERIDPTTL